MSSDAMTTERICVYTALFRNYERLNPPPMAGRSDVDWICFTDYPELASDDWAGQPESQTGALRLV